LQLLHLQKLGISNHEIEKSPQNSNNFIQKEMKIENPHQNEAIRREIDQIDHTQGKTELSKEQKVEPNKCTMQVPSHMFVLQNLEEYELLRGAIIVSCTFDPLMSSRRFQLKDGGKCAIIDSHGEVDGKGNWWGAALLPAVLAPPQKYFWRIRVDLYQGLLQIGVTVAQLFQINGPIKNTHLHHFWIGQTHCGPSRDTTPIREGDVISLLMDMGSMNLHTWVNNRKISTVKQDVGYWCQPVISVYATNQIMLTIL